MAIVANKRSVMTLYSGSSDIESHRTRIVLAEKGIFIDIIEVDHHESPGDFIDLNPYSVVPTLVDRNLVLYNANIIMEYLDERFPHPPLLPVYPVSRAEYRLMVYRIERDWYGLVHAMFSSDDEAEIQKNREKLINSLMDVLPIFSNSKYFLSNDFSLVDCCIAPICRKNTMF